jgi:hypothetical protein
MRRLWKCCPESIKWKASARKPPANLLGLAVPGQLSRYALKAWAKNTATLMEVRKKMKGVIGAAPGLTLRPGSCCANDPKSDLE